MPELPEVETMASDLRGEVLGRVIKDAQIFVPALIKYPSAAKFRKEIRDAKILNVFRRAKYLRFILSGERELIVHPKMTGHFLIIKKIKETPKELESLKYTRVRFYLDDKSELCFSDLRKFGTLRLLSKKQAEVFFAEMGPEPLSLKVDKFVSLISGQRRRIKQVLMDPSIIVGIGNIYSDEALFLAGIHPETPANRIFKPRLVKLYSVIKKVLQKGVKLRGSSINSYLDLRGEEGGYQKVRRVYGREGEACGKCGAKIARKMIAGRSAHFCPKCQQLS